MNNLNYNLQIFNDIPIYTFKTNNFTTITIKLYFINEFSKENATKYSLLTSLLTNTSKKYNTKKKVTSVLDNLYDANLFVSTNKMYQTRLTSITVSLVDPAYLQTNSNILKKGIELLKEFVFNPNIKDQSFDNKVFEEEKKQIIDYLTKQYDDKDFCAYKSFLTNMCEGENILINTNGSLDDINELTSNDIYNTYLDMINNSKKLICVIGDVNVDDTNKYLKDNILDKLHQVDVSYPLYSSDKKQVEEVKIINEKRDCSQAKLFMGYRANLTIKDPNYYPALVFTKMLGGLYDSTLTKVLREDNSLCYFVYDSYIADNNILFISSGIDKCNYNKAVDLIKNVFVDYKKGEFDHDLLDIVKKDMKDSFIALYDSPGGIINYFVSLIVAGYDVSSGLKDMIDKRIEKINHVTLEEVKEVSKEFILDTIYLMSE